MSKWETKEKKTIKLLRSEGEAQAVNGSVSVGSGSELRLKPQAYKMQNNANETKCVGVS